MGRVRGANTRPEIRVRRALHAAGHRFRLQARDLPGRPDIVFRADRVAIFVHGCFWHRHDDCAHTRTPKTKVEFWTEKFAANVERDRAAVGHLEGAGWTVLTIWECDTRDPDRLRLAVEKVSASRADAKSGRPATTRSLIASDNQSV